MAVLRKKTKHYSAGDTEVVENPTTEDVRAKECLCLNYCARFKPGKSDHCPAAQELYQIALKYGVAFPVTRCPVNLFQPKVGVEVR